MSDSTQVRQKVQLVAILNSKQFKDNSSYIFEMKFTKISDSGEKADKFQWVLIDQNKRYFLEFTECDNEVRILFHPQWKVRLNLPNNTIQLNGITYPLTEYTSCI